VLGKGWRIESQYPEWFKGKKDPCTSNMVKAVTETPIVWTFGSASRPDMWLTDSAGTVHISPNCEDFTNYQAYNESRNIQAFGNNSIKGVGEGDIEADI